MKFHIRTLGCKMNWLDTARLNAALQSVGHQAVSDEAEADTILVNTCTVTAEADRKSRKEVKLPKRREKQVAALGCAIRVNDRDWGEGDQRVLTFADERGLLAHFGVDPAQLPFPITSRTRLPVAIQTGCDNRCSFCITRIARGAHRNIPADQVLAQVRQAHELGINEVILTGINLAAWGCENSNHPEQARLAELLERLLRETEMPRIRLSSLGPQFLHDGFFDLFADSRLCSYLHLSIQSGSPRVLDAMDRGHGTDAVYRAVELARRAAPAAAIAADFIAGFPGEGEAEFAETETMIRDVAFAKLHVFPYSERTGTPAADFAQRVPVSERKRRAALLRLLGSELRRRFVQSQLGSTRQVLAEADGYGWTDNYIKVHVPLSHQGALLDVQLRENNVAENLSSSNEEN